VEISTKTSASNSPANSAERAENQLLICAARPHLNSALADRVHQLLEDELDWHYLLATANRHGVIALLYYRLSQVGAKVPPQIISKLRDKSNEISRDNFSLTAELIKTVHLLEAHDIQVISFKGPTLALSAYGDLGLRQFVDLDLFIHAHDIARAKQVLAKHGFTPVRDLSNSREAALLRFDSACAFGNEHQVLLDVHWRFSPVYFSLPLETDDLWRRLERVNIGTQVLFTLSAEDLLMVLCCHGFTHEWERLAWLCDVATLVERRENLDWDYLFLKAKRLGVLRIVLVGLEFARVLGASFPPHVRSRLEGDVAARKLADEMMSQFFTPHKNHLSFFEWLTRQLRMRERVRDKFSSLLRIMLTPRDYDWMFASVPASLSALYYLIRPIRMARAAGLRVLNMGSAKD